MPVRKFRSIQEMDAETWRRPGDPELYRAIRFVWDLRRRTMRRPIAAGVSKFHGIEAMSTAQDAARSSDA